jgi:hypothetical protein
MKRMKRLLTNILYTFLLLQTTLIYAVDNYQSNQLISVKCSPQLQRYLRAIQEIPEARTLIASIQQEGPIQIIVNNTPLSNQFGAFWDPDRRLICVAISPEETEGSLIGSILFELQNASVNSKFDQLDNLAVQRKIDKARYVQSMEYLEYINSLNAAKIAEKGIQMGVLPSSSRLPTFSSFEEHFSIQKMSGHSAHFAQNYDNLAS